MISYAPLFQTMKEKGITSYKLAKMGFPISNYHALRRGKNVSTHTINMLCAILQCNVADIMEYEEDNVSLEK
ncbi:MAG: helix-turn-helix transcriptional regulator [Oscillospiraceae bacterium]|nr:helix-turn-helix transcriptional regulator [Oscillospiraceae bacterium]